MNSTHVTARAVLLRGMAKPASLSSLGVRGCAEPDVCSTQTCHILVLPFPGSLNFILSAEYFLSLVLPMHLPSPCIVFFF
jgi:hypothetical protein